MAVYLVSYDLNSPVKDYSKVIPGIKQLGETYPVLKSQFLVSTNSTASDLMTSVRRLVDSNDDVFINRVTSDWAANMKNANVLKSWLDARTG